MIKKMERRFTIVAISVISFVLLILMILVNAISIRGNIRRADDALDRLLIESFISEKKDRRIDFAKDENRSFQVILDHELNVISANANTKNVIDYDSSCELAIEVAEEDKQYGFIDDYRYLQVRENGQIRVIFLDYSFERKSELNFIMVSGFAYVGTLLLVSILVILFLKPVMKPIKESYKKQKQFITDASHELKTPLTIISTDMELLEMENGKSEWIDSVNKQVNRLNTLTNELVTLSRMNEIESHILMTKTNLSHIVNDVVIGFEPAIEAKGKTLEVQVEEDLYVKGNEDSLERVLSILLDNALKYSDEHGTISVKLWKTKSKVKLSVHNTVEHIEVGNHDEVFQRFFRAEDSRNTKTGGFGIGLAVAKASIEEHNGKMLAKSTDGKSLEIHISLRAF